MTASNVSASRARTLDRELAAAVAAVREASQLCSEVQRGLLGEHEATKGDRSPVTVADLGAQALISLRLRKAFPDDSVVGEEDGSLLRGADTGAIADEVERHVALRYPGADRSAIADALDRCGGSGGARGRFWTLDPVDGTKGFLRRGQYAVALALIEDGRPVLGVLGCPNLPVDRSDDSVRGALFVGWQAGGAWSEPVAGGPSRLVSVSPPASLGGLRWTESVEKGHSDQTDAERIRAILGVQAEPLRIDSQAKYAVVARGEADVYLRLPVDPAYRERIWDHAAGWLIVTEAGGRVTDMDDRPIDFAAGRQLERNRGVVATSDAAVHEAVLRAVAEVVNNGSRV